MFKLGTFAREYNSYWAAKTERLNPRGAPFNVERHQREVDHCSEVTERDCPRRDNILIKSAKART